jgi:hypothetical protein
MVIALAMFPKPCTMFCFITNDTHDIIDLSQVVVNGFIDGFHK